MKRIATLAAAAFLTIAPALAQSHQTTTTDKQGNRVVIEISDAPSTKGDTLSVTTYTGKGSIADSLSTSGNDEDASVSINLSKDDVEALEDVIESLSSGGIAETALKQVVMPIVIIGLVGVLLPIVCIITVFVYNHKKRMAKYRLAEKMIDSGQPLPESLNDVLEDAKLNDLYSRGIKNICIGTALSFFLYFLTDEIAMGCIGLFIVANGVSQLLGFRRLEKAGMTSKTSQSKPTEENRSAEEVKPAEQAGPTE